jgi:hypothetical protein
VGLDAQGRVKATLHVDAAQRAFVYREAAFVIDTDTSGAPQVSMEDRGDRRTPVQPGDVIEGNEGVFGEIGKAVRKGGIEALRAMDGLGRKLSGYIQDLGQSPQARELRRSLDDFAERAGQVSGEELEGLRKARSEQIRRQASELADQLASDGKQEQAEQLRKKIDEWLGPTR